MEEQIIIPEKSFTFVMSKSDVETILTGLGELPAKYSHVLMNKIEMSVYEQSKEPGK